MAKMSLEELRKLRSEKRNELKCRDRDGKTMQIIVGMGTCGIAAGAKDTLDAFISELTKNGLAEHAIIRQTGCMDLCASEPTVELIVPDIRQCQSGQGSRNRKKSYYRQNRSR